MIFGDPAEDGQQGLNDVKIARDDKNYVPDQITSLESLRDIIRDSDFKSHCLTVTALHILLEVFGHVFISLTTSMGYIFYSLERKFMIYLIYFTQWSDAGGLFFGSLLGKTGFANSISPKKTVQGLIGAFILPMLISTLFWTLQHYIIPGQDWFITMPLVDYWFLSAVTAALAILGDLCESFLKRASGVKDSGATLGVHGGLFDRVDSILLNAVFYIWYVNEYV